MVLLDRAVIGTDERAGFCDYAVSVGTAENERAARPEAPRRRALPTAADFWTSTAERGRCASPQPDLAERRMSAPSWSTARRIPAVAARRHV